MLAFIVNPALPYKFVTPYTNNPDAMYIVCRYFPLGLINQLRRKKRAREDSSRAK